MKIFVSYRRAESADSAGRIWDRLVLRFGDESLFRDVHSITGGQVFPSVIRDAIAACDVLLVVIGPRWLDATDAAGARRLDDPEDFVRLEIEAALAADKLVIPLLVGGAVMPAPKALPPSIRPLASRHALPIRSDPDFQNDIQRLLNALQRPRSPIQRMSLRVIGASVLGIAALGLGLNASGIFDPEPDEPGTAADSTGAAPEQPQPPLPDLLRPTVPYNPAFLGPISVPLPAVTDALSAGDLLNGQVFDYVHYSLVMNERRAMPLYTAANFDRATAVRVRRELDRWLLDPRIPTDLQRGEAMYSRNVWDRGHLVYRLSVAWGDSALAARAALAAFFYSNATPQHANFNQGIWAGLERFVMDSLRPSSTRMSIFAGPVNRPDDYEYRGARIPRSFWKVVALNDPANPRNLFVHGYVMDQYTLDPNGNVVPVTRGNVSGPLDPTPYQVSVAQIEALTPLRFGILKDFDTYRPSGATAARTGNDNSR